MDTVSTIYLASFVGAGLFFGSGYLLRSLRQRPTTFPAGPFDAPADHEAAALRQQLAQLQQRHDQLSAKSAAPSSPDPTLQQEVERLQQALAVAERSHADCQARAESATAQTNSLQQEIARLKAARVSPPEVKRLQHQMGVLRQQKASLQKLVDELTNEKTINEDDQEQTDVRKPEDLAAQAAVTDQAIARVETAEAAMAQMRRQLNETQQKAKVAAQRANEIASLHRQITELEQRLAQAEGQTTDQLAKAEKQAASALEKVEKLSSEGEGLRRRNTELNQQLEQLRQQTVALRDDAARLKTDAARATEAEGEVKGLRMRLQAAEAKAAEAEALRDQLAELRQQIESADQGPANADEIEGLKRTERDLLVKSQLLRQRIEELERYADENVQLREQIKELEPNAAKAEEFLAQVRELEAEIFASGIRAASSAESPTVTGIRSATDGPSAAGTVGGTLDDRLGELTRHGRYSAAVLADVQGLPLAASGAKPHHESLAAVSSLVREMATRARDLLPLSSPTLIEIVDANDIGVRSRLFSAENETLVLTTLGNRLSPADKVVEGLIASLPGIISTDESPPPGK
jgi:chromosome segregation ATPase